MLLGKRVCAVIPARGGSKGVPRKNLRRLHGKTLIELVAQVVKSLDWIDRSVATTDDEEIASEARRCGLDVPFMRDSNLAGDESPVIDAWREAIARSEEVFGEHYDISILLEPTSPLRKSEHITQTAKALIQSDYDAAATVSETDAKFHPQKQLILEDSDLRHFSQSGAKIINRQELGKTYHLNGAAYCVNVPAIMRNRESERRILDFKTLAVVLPDTLINIDTLLDLEIAEMILKPNS